MITNDLFEYLHDLMLEPHWLFLILILATFILEDAATIAATALALSNMINPFSAYMAIMIGIIIGDMALYGLGYGANKIPALYRLTERHNLMKYRDRLKDHTPIVIITARFIPGARLPSYMAMGYFKIPFLLFIAVVICAVGVWSSVLFWGFYFLGNLVSDYVSPMTLAGLAIAVIVFYILINRYRK